MARDRLLEVVKFAKCELKNYADVLTYSQEPGTYSGVLLILHPLSDSSVEFEIMFDIVNIVNNDDVVVTWLCEDRHKFSDAGVFNLTAEGWRAALGGVEMYWDAAANAVDFVENDRKVMTWLVGDGACCVLHHAGQYWRIVIKRLLANWRDMQPMPVRH
jgi:hypothetical protein